MDNTRTLSIVIPTYNRYEMTLESFAQVVDDVRVDEIVIVDDCSTDGSWGQFWTWWGFCSDSQQNKIKLFRNDANQDCYKNKQIAISHATNDWCILLDSDNIIGIDYLDALFSIPRWEEDTIYQPVFAKPHFNFTHLAGKFIDKANAKDYIQDDKFTTALNAMNFCINKNTYLNAFNPDIIPVTSDSIYLAYRLLEQGNKYYFVPGLEYEHRVGHASHYTTNVHKTPSGFHQSIIDKIANL
jgi:glycosyltransferase involved in cell wall biosynthesis